MATICGTVINWEPGFGGSIFSPKYGTLFVPVSAFSEEDADRVMINTPLTLRAELTVMKAWIGNHFDVRFKGLIKSVNMTNPALGMGTLIIEVESELARALGWGRETVLSHWTGWRRSVVSSIGEGLDIIGDSVSFSLTTYNGHVRAIEVELELRQRQVAEKAIVAPINRKKAYVESEDPSYWLHRARTSADMEVRAQAMKKAVECAKHVMHTHLGTVLFQPAHDDPEYWTIYLCDGSSHETSMSTCGHRYAMSVSFGGSGEEERARATALYTLLEFLLAVSLTPAEVVRPLQLAQESLTQTLMAYIRRK